MLTNSASVVKSFKDCKHETGEGEDVNEVCKLRFKSFYAVNSDCGGRGVGGAADVEQMHLGFRNEFKLSNVKKRVGSSGVANAGRCGITRLPAVKRDQMEQVTSADTADMLGRSICTATVDPQIVASFRAKDKTVRRKYRGMKKRRGRSPMCFHGKP